MRNPVSKTKEKKKKKRKRWMTPDELYTRLSWDLLHIHIDQHTYEHITDTCTYPLTPSMRVFSVSVIKYEQSNPRKKGFIWWRGVSQLGRVWQYGCGHRRKLADHSFIHTQEEGDRKWHDF